MNDATVPQGARHGPLLCPSTQHDSEGARVFGVIAGEPGAAEVHYLDQAMPVTDEIIAMAAPVTPAEVFRIAGKCLASTACAHWDDGRAKCPLDQSAFGNGHHTLPAMSVPSMGG